MSEAARKCWNCDASPNPEEDFWDLDGAPMTSWSCPKCSDRWMECIDGQDREMAAVKREAARLRRRVATLEGRLARVLDLLNDKVGGSALRPAPKIGRGKRFCTRGRVWSRSRREGAKR